MDGIIVYYRPKDLYGGIGFIETRVENKIQRFCFRRFEVISLPTGMQHPEVGMQVRFKISSKRPKFETDCLFAADVEVLTPPPAIAALSEVPNERA